MDSKRPGRRAPNPKARPVEPIHSPQPRVVSCSKTSRGGVSVMSEHRRRVSTPRNSDSRGRAQPRRRRAVPTRGRARTTLGRNLRATWRPRAGVVAETIKFDDFAQPPRDEFVAYLHKVDTAESARPCPTTWVPKKRHGKVSSCSKRRIFDFITSPQNSSRTEL